MRCYRIGKFIVDLALTVVQELIILLIFVVALEYLGNRIYRNFAKKQAGCGKGCGCVADSKPATLTINKR